MKLVVRDQQGQLTLTCPTCRQATPVPANGVAGLQSAFQVNPLLEILEEHKKAKDTAANQEGAKSVVTHPKPSRKVVANCFQHTDKERELYCETCGDLICIKCAIKGGKHHDHDHYVLDEAFERYKGEIAPSFEPLEVKLVAVKEALAQLDKRCAGISDHRVAIEANIHDTTRRLHEILDVRKTELISQLHKMTQRKLKDLAFQRDQMETILAQLSSCLDFVRESLKMNNQGEVLMMKTNIVNQVKELTSPFQPGVLKPNEEADMNFSVLQDLIAKCQNYGQIFTPGSPDPSKCQATGKGLEVAVVGEKSTAIVQAVNFEGKSCVKSINSLQCELVSLITGATERGNVEYKGQNRYEISYCPTIKGKHQLHIKVDDTHISGSPFSVRVKLPVEKLGTPILTIDGVVVNQRGEVVVMEGKSLEEAVVGEKSTAVVEAVNFEGKSCVKSISSLQCELVSLITGATERGNVEHKGQNQYEISYCPTIKGKHQLHIKIEDTHISGSPFSVRVKLPVEKLGTPILTIDVNGPRGVVVNQRGEVVVMDGDCVSVFSPSGKKLQSFGSRGSDQGQFAVPWGMAVDGEGNILVADTGNHRIQKFTASGQFLCAVGTQGKGPLQFNRPMYIAFNVTNNRIYVTENENFRVQVLNSDLTFSNTFGRKGSGRGQIRGICAIACDTTGNVYVVDGCRIQVFTPDGMFLRMFGKHGSGRGKLKVPWGIAIDSSDVVYVSENGNHRVSVFTSKGQFMSSFGEEGEGLGEFNSPLGVAVDDSGVVYVCDGFINRIQVF